MGNNQYKLNSKIIKIRVNSALVDNNMMPLFDSYGEPKGFTIKIVEKPPNLRLTYKVIKHIVKQSLSHFQYHNSFVLKRPKIITTLTSSNTMECTVVVVDIVASESKVKLFFENLTSTQDTEKQIDIETLQIKVRYELPIIEKLQNTKAKKSFVSSIVNNETLAKILKYGLKAFLNNMKTSDSSTNQKNTDKQKNRT
jgi:hypothetical protein